jgi:large subunit ribosomal protein L25
MAQQAKLTVQRRTQVGRNAVKKIKTEGFVPGTIYGAHQEPINLQVKGRDLSTLLSHAAGENILVDLEIIDSGIATNSLALIQEVQHHPLKSDLVHVDFRAVSATEKVTAEVTIETVGEPIGVKTYGGLLEHPLRALEVECLPKDLPEIIEVDVSQLNVGDSLHVSHLQLPEGVEAITDGDITVALVVAPRVEDASAAAEAPTAPEVIREKKAEPEATA